MMRKLAEGRDVRKRVVDDQSDTVLATARHQLGLDLACNGVVHSMSNCQWKPRVGWTTHAW